MRAVGSCPSRGSSDVTRPRFQLYICEVSPPRLADGQPAKLVECKTISNWAGELHPFFREEAVIKELGVVLGRNSLDHVIR